MLTAILILLVALTIIYRRRKALSGRLQKRIAKWKDNPQNFAGALALIALGLALFIHFFILGTLQSTFDDGTVSGGLVRHPFDWIIIHRSPKRYIRVAGKTYRGVRGLEPFYLDLPKLRSLLFVTERGSSGVTIHILHRDTWKETVIDAKLSSFGNNIGSQGVGGKYRDYVEQENPEQMVLTTDYKTARKKLFLNLGTGNEIREEYEEVDGAGKILKHEVYVGGKLVQ